eukprot:scaffold522114_cov17-Prasinocladus_malaysianus.AAC.1
MLDSSKFWAVSAGVCEIEFAWQEVRITEAIASKPLSFGLTALIRCKCFAGNSIRVLISRPSVLRRSARSIFARTSTAMGQESGRPCRTSSL